MTENRQPTPDETLQRIPREQAAAIVEAAGWSIDSVLFAMQAQVLVPERLAKDIADASAEIRAALLRLRRIAREVRQS